VIFSVEYHIFPVRLHADISNADTTTLSTSEETAGDSTYSINQPPNVTEVTDTTHKNTVLSSMSTDITNIHTSTSSLYTSKMCVCLISGSILCENSSFLIMKYHPTFFVIL
jgi:hypothetical protein